MALWLKVAQYCPWLRDNWRLESQPPLQPLELCSFCFVTLYQVEKLLWGNKFGKGEKKGERKEEGGMEREKERKNGEGEGGRMEEKEGEEEGRREKNGLNNNQLA